MNRFVLLSQRMQGVSGPSGPFDGVPKWLQYSLTVWVDLLLTFTSGGGINGGLLGRLERELRLPLAGNSDSQRYNQLMSAIVDPETFLDVVDFLLFTLDRRRGEDNEKSAYLEETLAQAGSAWKVADVGDSFQLAKRIDDSAATLLTESATATDRAAKHLGEAVTAAYGRKPNPSHSYREAVRAVEAAARPIVLPNDKLATLGKVIQAMKDKPDKWQAALRPSKGDPVLMVVDMLSLLWTGQLDRHGTDDDEIPLNVTVEEAAAAVHLAGTLVQWFRSGAISAV